MYECYCTLRGCIVPIIVLKLFVLYHSSFVLLSSIFIAIILFIFYYLICLVFYLVRTVNCIVSSYYISALAFCVQV